MFYSHHEGGNCLPGNLDFLDFFLDFFSLPFFGIGVLYTILFFSGLLFDRFFSSLPIITS